MEENFSHRLYLRKSSRVLIENVFEAVRNFEHIVIRLVVYGPVALGNGQAVHLVESDEAFLEGPFLFMDHIVVSFRVLYVFYDDVAHLKRAFPESHL